MSEEKRPVGRPPKFATPDLLQAAIDAYFVTRDMNNRPTMTGLGIVIGLTRQGLLEYAAKDDFSEVIVAAKARVEEFVENRLYDPNATGCIFNLKNNFGWRDKSEQELSGADGGPVEINVTRRIVRGLEQ